MIELKEIPGLLAISVSHENANHFRLDDDMLQYFGLENGKEQAQILFLPSSETNPVQYELIASYTCDKYSEEDAMEVGLEIFNNDYCKELHGKYYDYNYSRSHTVADRVLESAKASLTSLMSKFEMDEGMTILIRKK